jgi:hypothetical protein
MTEYDELARKAREATPGPWEALGSRLKVARGVEGLGRMESDGTDYPTGETLTWEQMEHETTANAAYIAAASPDVILALLEERKVLREALYGEQQSDSPSGACRTDPLCYRNAGHDGDHAYPAALQAEPVQEGAER